MFKSSVVAIVTPFTEEGEVDYPAFKKLVDWHIAEGTDAILISGSTGESSTLTDEEQEKLIKTALDVANKRIPILAGTGTNCTKKTVEKTAQAKALGADGCLVVVPYYNRPMAEGCLAHYQEVSKVGLPTVVYYHPVRTAVRLSPEVLVEICKLPSIVAIKISGGLEPIKRFKELSNVPIYSGDDELTYEMLELGAIGGISVVANAIPRQWKEMIDSYLRGDKTRANELNTLYSPLCQALILETNPQGIKYGVSLLGKCGPYLRLPLLQPRQSTKRALFEALSKILPTGLEQNRPEIQSPNEREKSAKDTERTWAEVS